MSKKQHRAFTTMPCSSSLKLSIYGRFLCTDKSIIAKRKPFSQSEIGFLLHDFGHSRLFYAVYCLFQTFRASFVCFDDDGLCQHLDDSYTVFHNGILPSHTEVCVLTGRISLLLDATNGTMMSMLFPFFTRLTVYSATASRYSSPTFVFSILTVIFPIRNLFRNQMSAITCQEQSVPNRENEQGR